MELSEAIELLADLKTRRGPVPSRQPTLSVTEKGWWIFDASESPEVENSVRTGE
jgi:hypothetical protein